MKEQRNFRSLNCEGCQCDKCHNACSNCVQCYRADYAEEDWDDYYYKGQGEEDCSEKIENFDWSFY